MSNVIPTAKPRKEGMQASVQKWGQEVIDRGFCILPSILIRAQRQIDITPTQLNILLNLIDWWSYPERNPWSSKSDLATRIGISARQLQRQVAVLEKNGLVLRIERKNNRGKIPNEYDLTGLVNKLQALAPSFLKADKARQEVEQKPRRPRSIAT